MTSLANDVGHDSFIWTNFNYFHVPSFVKIVALVPKEKIKQKDRFSKNGTSNASYCVNYEYGHLWYITLYFIYCKPEY